MPEAAAAYAEILAVTEAACAALEAGETLDLAAFARRRAALVEAATPATRSDIDALRRILDLDGRLHAHLAAEGRRLGDELTRLGQRRRTLASYRGSRTRSAVYFDRLG